MNTLKINARKSKTILFHTKDKRMHIHTQLNLSDLPMKVVKQYKVIGVTSSPDMSWDFRIESLIKSLSSTAGDFNGVATLSRRRENY